ncbi:DUF2332 domain-containing protein [Nocardia sp. NPDC049707]|uniref:DUF2332 domain-containing protein n=1 Tax=Nocardia sp. NPDC049707 TaxID=3154735 RepID=UPI003444B907
MDSGTAGRYRRFGEFEARGSSSCYELWALGIASDRGLLSLIDQLPQEKRQPNLVLAASRYLGVAETSFPEFRDWMLLHWDAVAEVVLARSTQTNEVGRAAVLVPVFAQLPGPLALIEVGASAGLCLYPDLFSYQYDDRNELHPDCGESGVVLRCATSGAAPIPDRLPQVVSRAGVDLNPLDVNDADEMRWLECLVWPGQPDRLRRLREAVAIARSRPADVVSGDLNEKVAELVHAAPKGATVVVFHSAVLAYSSVDERIRFEHTVRGLPCHWLSNEGSLVVESVADRLPVPPQDTPGRFVVALDGIPLGYAAAHGQTLDWFTTGPVR